MPPSPSPPLLLFDMSKSPPNTLSINLLNGRPAPKLLRGCRTTVYNCCSSRWSHCLWNRSSDSGCAPLSWKCCCFRCRQQLVLKTCLRVFLTRRPDTANVSATSCDVGLFFSVSYVMSLHNSHHVVIVTTHLSCLLLAKLFSCRLWYSSLM